MKVIVKMNIWEKLTVGYVIFIAILWMVVGILHFLSFVRKDSYNITWQCHEVSGVTKITEDFEIKCK